MGLIQTERITLSSELHSQEPRLSWHSLSLSSPSQPVWAYMIYLGADKAKPEDRRPLPPSWTRAQLARASAVWERDVPQLSSISVICWVSRCLDECNKSALMDLSAQQHFKSLPEGRSQISGLLLHWVLLFFFWFLAARLKKKKKRKSFLNPSPQ